ncbi:MAG: hypothetical protein K2H44_05035 [Muribaculaceae bacterium]|nr:hypothetical protein [Muribaculaceae bacterium]MDE5844730.1 hypothetical protein [Muribaculaceae bacterium]
MTNKTEILRRVREKVGLGMTRSADFEVLSQSIKDNTNENLGVNTLKRLFGFKNDKVVPRLSTMDIIARYLGSEDYESLIKELGEDTDISLFTPIDCIEVKDLGKGTQIRIAYAPNREFFLTYLGDSQFIVNGVKGSKNIMTGDLLTISQLAVGHKFVISHVIRDDKDLGAYESAKFKGLKSVEIL